MGTSVGSALDRLIGEVAAMMSCMTDCVTGTTAEGGY